MRTSILLLLSPVLGLVLALHRAALTPLYNALPVAISPLVLVAVLILPLLGPCIPQRWALLISSAACALSAAYARRVGLETARLGAEHGALAARLVLASGVVMPLVAGAGGRRRFLDAVPIVAGLAVSLAMEEWWGRYLQRLGLGQDPEFAVRSAAGGGVWGSGRAQR